MESCINGDEEVPFCCKNKALNKASFSVQRISAAIYRIFHAGILMKGYDGRFGIESKEHRCSADDGFKALVIGLVLIAIVLAPAKEAPIVTSRATFSLGAHSA